MVTYCVPELFMRCMYTVLRKQAAPTAYKKFYMQMEAARILSFLGSLLILIIHIRDTKPFLKCQPSWSLDTFLFL